MTIKIEKGVYCTDIPNKEIYTQVCDALIKLGACKDEGFSYSHYKAFGNIGLHLESGAIHHATTIKLAVFNKKVSYKDILTSVDDSCDWYDYDKQVATTVPETETLVVCPETLNILTVVYDKINTLGDIIVLSIDVNNKTRWLSMEELKPLDWNKNVKKVVDLEWLINSGVDCEFSDRSDEWYLEYCSGMCEKRCQPRQNHKMFLTRNQVDLIPEGFDITKLEVSTRLVTQGYIVEFNGLEDNYIYPWENK